MEIILLLCGIVFFIIGLASLIKAGWSEEARYSWRMGFLSGGIAWIGFYLLLRNNGRALLSLPGSGVFSIVLAIVGTVFLARSKKVAFILRKLQLPGLKFIFGDPINWESNWMLRVYQVGIIFAGAALLVGAWANYYSPR
jgi:hypothetical protein